MAAPSQLQARYLPEEDRISLRMNTVAQEEFRFWLTRRFLTRMWPVLQDGLMSSPVARQQADPLSRQAVVEFEHEQAQAKAQFNAPFQTTSHLPLGATPLLVVQANFRHLPNGDFFLNLKNNTGHGIDLTLTRDLLHLLCQLLDDAAQLSDWDLPALFKNGNGQQEPVATHRLN